MRKFLFIFILVSQGAFAQTKATRNLFMAIQKNNVILAENALKEGADPNGVDNFERPTTTVLIKATELNRPQIVSLLLSHHADVNIRRPVDLQTPLMVAARADLPLIAKSLIHKGADVNLETILNQTALHFTAAHNSTLVAKELLSAKEIDVNANPRLCALAVAARGGHFGMVVLLKKQIGAKASSPVCVEKAIEFAEKKKFEKIVSRLKRI